MELLAPAGSVEKLRYAYRYGADAAYMGLPGFSLRANAENIADELPESPEIIRRIKGNRRLFCALNIYFHNADLRALHEQLDRVAEYPFDAFIVSDIGLLPILRKRLPEVPLHLSTQANCTNREAARLYYEMGFTRIVAGRELSLAEISEIKDAVPELEIEVFVHGAVCVAYSGRCFISKWAADRSANQGDCAHSCRWNYRLALEEEQRPGEYHPLELGSTAGGSEFTTLMSSKDICMIDHLEELRNAGVDSLKIEGRIKSLYYVALVTRAYRHALDAPGLPNPFRDDLFAVSHREFSTGFYFGRDEIETPAVGSYRRTHLFLGSLERDLESAEPGAEKQKPSAPANGWSPPLAVKVRNTITADTALELIGPTTPSVTIAPGEFRLLGPDREPTERLVNQHGGFFQLNLSAHPKTTPDESWILRRPAHQ